MADEIKKDLTEEEKAKRDEIEELLARTRKNIAESRELVSQVELRIAETDRFLAQHGLTREQVLGMRFTPAQKLAVNEELQRMGLPPIEDDDAAYDFSAATAELRDGALESVDGAANDVLVERNRKLGQLMYDIRL